MKKIKLFIAILTSGFVLFFILYQSNTFRYYSGYFFERIPGPIKPNYSSIDSIFNNFDIYKVLFFDRSQNKIDLQLSPSDIQEFQKEKKFFSQIGYQKDSARKWRKVSLISGTKKYNAKIKLHGTNVRQGSDSFKLKLDKDGDYFNGLRRFNLIYAQGEAPLSVTSPNILARSYGMLSPIGEYVNLYINGIFHSTYYLSDGLSKETLEEHYKITDYAVFKPNDDWDRMRPGHTSHADLSIGNMEISGSYSNPGHAMSRLEDFFQSIKESTVFHGETFVDIDYFSKFLALHALTSETHNVAGDNLKLLLNLRNGKIYPIFRNEGSSTSRLNTITMNPNKTIENFNRLWFHSTYPEKEAPALKLFKIFLQDGNLRSKRDKYLHSYLNENRYKQTLNSLWENNESVLKSGNAPRRFISYDHWANEQHYNKVSSLAKEYLDYSKLYVLFDNKSNTLQVQTDTFQPIHIQKIDYIDSQGLESSIQLDKLIEAPDLNNDLWLVEKRNILKLDADKDIKLITRIYAKNTTTNKNVDNEDIYISDFDFSYFKNKNYIKVLKNSGVIFEHQKNTIRIKSGKYKLDDHIIFPEGVNLIIEPGVELNLFGSILVRGGLDIKGEATNSVYINLNEIGKNSSFIVLGKGDTKVNVSHAIFTGGSDTYVNGIHSSAAFMVDNSIVELTNIKIQNSIADDGLNLRNSQIILEDSVFSDNAFDQVDIDFSIGTIQNNLFSGKYSAEGDGLDLSGSSVNVLNNKFQKIDDKALSVGEKTTVCVYNNTFMDTKIGIASKDASNVFEKDNKYFDVDSINSVYLKKKMYQKPGVINNISSINEVECL